MTEEILPPNDTPDNTGDDLLDDAPFPSMALWDALGHFSARYISRPRPYARFRSEPLPAVDFVQRMEDIGLTVPDQVQAQHVYMYLAELRDSGFSEKVIREEANVINTMLGDWYSNSYIHAPVLISMRKVAKAERYAARPPYQPGSPALVRTPEPGRRSSARMMTAGGGRK